MRKATLFAQAVKTWVGPPHESNVQYARNLSVKIFAKHISAGDSQGRAGFCKCRASSN